MAEAEFAGCPNDGQTWPEGTVRCIGGLTMRCTKTGWVFQGTYCKRAIEDYPLADPTETDDLSNLNPALMRALDERRIELKSLLAADLQDLFSLCYWGPDGCYWCTEDGRNWYRVKCIS